MLVPKRTIECPPKVFPLRSGSPGLRKKLLQSPSGHCFRSRGSQEASPKVTPKHQRGADDVTPERVLQRISGLMTEMTAMESSLENLREQMEKEEAHDLDLEPLLELEEEASSRSQLRNRSHARVCAAAFLHLYLGWKKQQGSKGATLIIGDLRALPYSEARKGRPSIPMQSRSNAPKRVKSSSADVASPVAGPLRSVQKPASLGFLAHGGPGERQMREQMLQMRAAAAAASAGRQALARRPRPTVEEEARLEASIHDYTKEAIEEAGDSSTVSCWSGDDRSSEVVMELGHGTDDDTLGVSSPVSDFDFEAADRSRLLLLSLTLDVSVQEGGAGVGQGSELAQTFMLPVQASDIFFLRCSVEEANGHSCSRLALNLSLEVQVKGDAKFRYGILALAALGMCKEVVMSRQMQVMYSCRHPSHDIQRPVTLLILGDSPQPPFCIARETRSYLSRNKQNQPAALSVQVATMSSNVMSVAALAPKHPSTWLWALNSCLARALFRFLHLPILGDLRHHHQITTRTAVIVIAPVMGMSRTMRCGIEAAGAFCTLVAVVAATRISLDSSHASLGHFEVPREQIATRMASKEARAMELGPRRKVRFDHGKRVEAKLFALLQRLSPSVRQFALQSFNQAQRLALERWILAERAGESSRPSPAVRNRSLAGRASSRPSQKGRQGKSGMAGLHLHQRGQKRYYRASVVAGPFCLKTGLTQGADKARRFLEALLRIRARVLTSLLQEPACTEQGLEALEVAFRSAIQEELTGLGSGRLYFYANIPASYWVGQALTTPHFPVLGEGLDHGLWTQEAATPLSKGHAAGPLKSTVALLSYLGSQTTSLRICFRPSLLEAMASMMGGMGDAMKEQAKKKIEDEMADKAPGSIKPFFPCCGGPVGTMDKCICMVPADQQEQVKSAIDTQ
ncbi:unnamed protein product [Symbiodinium sp. CCMP2592]|nr:unnamed protein product [Symbiodinium sp. CCMP2592]